jgi:beta-phosphoglucomutase
MDGVITNSMPEHYQAWKKVLTDEGIDITRHEIYLREGQPGQQTIKELFAADHLEYSEKKAKAILQKKERFFKKIVKTRFIPGIRSFLKGLDQQGFQMALVTGTARHEVQKMLPVSLNGLFDAIITGSDVTHGKPHPEPFRKVLQQLALPAADCVVIENAPFGIRSAHRAGLRCIALQTSLPRQYLSDAEWVFSSVAEMRAQMEFCYQKEAGSCL